MPKKVTEIDPPPGKKSLGDKIRGIADQLRQDTEVQIKATSRILGAAAQIAQNHDRLIDEVTEMVEQDLEQEEQAQRIAKAIGSLPQTYTEETLKQQFKTLNQAKAHFDIKANSWAALAAKLNQAPAVKSAPSPQQDVLSRLEGIEAEVTELRAQVTQVLTIVTEILTVVNQGAPNRK
ncbi:hypothetical protein BST81_03430 [Leptolyngbya sp. 'hensonii']|uniref:hypothetical protein n=1 Tax=Leptolyngbya sp. 'hensonii' TaxID=1922337 RepID=UPI00094FD3DB|nr:hypothetical protein [Leptolyngbya sp. 'hensonii']OLP19838.1 hypothetical protein BST81_03430 [Leptolyngbya sp. 'hensonii']